MRYKLSLLITLLSSLTLTIAQLKIEKIEPPNWWIGMKLNKIQLMVYGKELAGADITFSNPAISVLKVHDTPNPDYKFIDIEIPPTLQPGEHKNYF